MRHLSNSFLLNWCDRCIQPPHHSGCGYIFQSILAAIVNPPELVKTHEICQWCLELHPIGAGHAQRCVFAQQGFRLHAAGWSTPTSRLLLKNLRRARFPYLTPLVNVLRNVLAPHITHNTVIVPLPMKTRGKTDRWLEFVHSAITGLNDIVVAPLITRNKQNSTRSSGSRERRSIVRDEYLVDEAQIEVVRGRGVVLLDDNVTTGSTMIGCVQLLQPYQSVDVVPITIERYLSPRLLQRCITSTPDTCAYFASRYNE